MVGRAAGGGGGSRRALSGAASLGRVGFVGLGAMGGPMALNLGKAGLSSELLLFDADTEKTKELAGEIDGGVACGSLKEVAEGADVIVTMLPASVHVQAVYLDKKDGLLRHVNPGTLLIDSSTISPQVSQEVSAAAAKAGSCMMLDAPVSGGTKKAVSGELTFMVGGDELALAAAEPLFGPMAGKVVHCGGSGAGQAAKICNNLAMSINMAGLCEATALAGSLGLDLHVFADIVNSSSGGSWISEVYGCAPGLVENSPANNGYQGGFANALLLKDIRLALEAAEAAGSPSPMGGQTEALWGSMVEAGHADLDQGSLYWHKYVQKTVE